eukprot:scaffold27313_cov85-Phaeocystis_antarctica.AAC.2
MCGVCPHLLLCSSACSPALPLQGLRSTVKHALSRTDATHDPLLLHSYMASALRRHKSASPASWAFIAGAVCSAAARSKCVAASLSSAAEGGPASQASHCPVSTMARIWLASTSSGAALTTLADSALSSLSFHHSGLATSAHSCFASISKARAVASAQNSEPTGQRSLASRYRCAASTSCPELASAAPRLWYASGLSGLRAMASRATRAALRESS